MAFCVKCAGEMSPTETICPHCGHDFPIGEVSRPTTIRRAGLAYSNVAHIALIGGEVSAVFGCFGGFLFSIARISEGNWIEGLVLGPMAATFFFACVIVFMRMRE